MISSFLNGKKYLALASSPFLVPFFSSDILFLTVPLRKERHCSFSPANHLFARNINISNSSTNQRRLQQHQAMGQRKFVRSSNLG